MANLPYFIPEGYRAVTTIPQEEHFNDMRKNGEEIVQEPQDIFVPEHIRNEIMNSKGENDGN